MLVGSVDFSLCLFLSNSSFLPVSGGPSEKLDSNSPFISATIVNSLFDGTKFINKVVGSGVNLTYST